MLLIKQSNLLYRYCESDFWSDREWWWCFVVLFRDFCTVLSVHPHYTTTFLFSGSLGLLLGLEDLDNDLLLLDQEGADDAGTDGAG